MKKLKDSSFGVRLREAFGGARNTVIAEKMGVTPSTMTEYMQGATYPDVEKLIRISEITKHSIHWLLTGKGDSDLDPLAFLDEAQREVIQKLAKEPEKEEALVAELVTEALAARASGLFANYKILNQDEIKQLRFLYDLLPAGEPVVGRKVRTIRKD